MDISKLYNSEHLFDLEVKRPDTDEPVGISMKIRAASSDPVMSIIRKQANENVTLRQKGKTLTASVLEDQKVEQAAACIESWDWGDETYGDLGVPKDTFANKCRVLKEQGWIFAQVDEAANEFANFTDPSDKTASTA